jgi:solute carrier family 7 (L-type amino acid transporter), member 9/15
MPATLSILAIVFVESIFSAAGVTDQAASIEHKLLSVLVMALTNLANSISTKATTRLNNFFVGTKFLSIAGIVAAAFVVLVIHLADPSSKTGPNDWQRKPWFGFRDTITPDGRVLHWSDVGEWDMFGYFSAALYGALWAYSGWDKVSLRPPSPVSACFVDW